MKLFNLKIIPAKKKPGLFPVRAHYWILNFLFAVFFRIFLEVLYGFVLASLIFP